MLPDPIVDFLTSGVAGLGVWGVLGVLLVVTQLTIFAVTLYLHRSQAHRGVDFHPVLAHFFRFWTWLTTSMITREWVAIHRKHHAKVETDEDPHSPQTKGIGQVFWRGVELYRQARAERADIEQYGKGAPSDWIERHLYTPHANAGPSHQHGAVRLARHRAVGDPDGVDSVLGRRRGQRAGPLVGLSQFRIGRHLHQPHAVGAVDRRRRTAQQPPCLPQFGTLLDAALGAGYRLDRHCRPAGAGPCQGVAGGAVAGYPPQHRRARCRHAQGLVVASLPGHDRLSAQRAQAGGAKLRELLPRRLRKGLVDDGSWLQPDARAQLQAWVAQRPRMRTLVEYRARLTAVLEARSHDASERLRQLQQWCHEAEASGNAALQAYAARLKGYALSGA